MSFRDLNLQSGFQNCNTYNFSCYLTLHSLHVHFFIFVCDDNTKALSLSISLLIHWHWTFGSCFRECNKAFWQPFLSKRRSRRSRTPSGGEEFLSVRECMRLHAFLAVRWRCRTKYKNEKRESTAPLSFFVALFGNTKRVPLAALLGIALCTLTRGQCGTESIDLLCRYRCRRQALPARTMFT